MTDRGYVPLARGTRVRFLRRGGIVEGKIVAVHLDPNRSPGVGRVSYDVETHPAFYPIRVVARRVEVLDRVSLEERLAILNRGAKS